MDPGADRVLELVAVRHARRREFNERLARLEGAESAFAATLFRCECGLIACGATIKLTAREYDELRGDPRHYAVLTAHVIPEAERVVATHRGWMIVESARVARRPAPETANFQPDATEKEGSHVSAGNHRGRP